MGDNVAANEEVLIWDRETDVVIAGYGGAGAVAAIEAHDAGAEVLILESTDKGGGNTIISFGGFLCPTNVEEAVTYISGLFDLSLSAKDDSLIRIFAEESVKNVEWVTGLKEGTKVHSYGGAGFPTVEGAESMNKYIAHGDGKGMTGFAQNLFNLFRYAVEDQREIPVLTRTPARRLVTNHSGEVVGMIAEAEGKEISIKAKRAVILTTGGYEADIGMLQNHVKGFPIHSLGHPGNTGDGIRMAQKVGAGLWHMNGVSCALGIKVPGFESAFGILMGRPEHIFVDKGGKRFVNEVEIENHAGLLAVDFYDAQSLEYPRIPCYAIFDEEVRNRGRITKMAGLGAAGVEHEWSKDNSVEIEKGWIKKGETLKSLAESIHVDPVALERTISKWNQDVDRGEDTDFGREIAADDGSMRIETAPFYAVELYPCLINTQGGPRRNGKAQVLDAFGDPIPRLYSAGELGSMWGQIYQGSGNIAECIVFGRIAGKNGASEEPWN